MLRSFARLARYRPAKGNIFNDMSILGAQVSAVCELIECTHGLRAALDLWIMHMLGCQRLWAPQRLAVCAVHTQLSRTGASFGMLPNFLVRKVLGFLFPEKDPVQAKVACVLPPHAESSEVAIVLGHLLWSCPPQLWEEWCSLGLAVVEALLSVSRKAEVHHAGIILFAACGRLKREPVGGAQIRAVVLGRRLAMVAEGVNLAEGFVRHRIANAVEVAAEVGSCKARQD